MSVYFGILCVLKNFRAEMLPSFGNEEETEVSNVEGLVQGHNVIY